MKLVNLFRKTPFLFTVVIIILISISNQKQSTRLKIFIWNTPSLPVGTYLAISTVTGFIISYIVTSKLANTHNLNFKKEIKYKFDEQEEGPNSNDEKYNEKFYENTFIERDFKDPSPTIKANFRIIGTSKRKNESLQKNQQNKYDSTEFVEDSEYQYRKQEINYKNDREINQISSDWEDDTYTNW